VFDDSDPVVGKTRNDLQRTVGRTIVYDQKFEIDESLAQNRLDRLENEVFFVEKRNDD